MGFGNQSRSLIIASKNQGWDPTKIQGSDESIANFDRDPDRITHKTTGSLPEGTPDGWPDDLNNPALGGMASSSPFSHPDVARENAARHTAAANPFVGMPGAGGGPHGRPARGSEYGLNDSSGDTPGMDSSSPSGSAPVQP